MPHTPTTSTTPITPAMQRCVDDNIACARACAETLAHCLQMGGPHTAPEHVGLLLDCATICETNAKFMLHASPYHGRTCAVCAEICEACAKSCDALGGEPMKACADACRRCAESCHQMARA